MKGIHRLIHLSVDKGNSLKANELLFGYAGYLYALAFVNKHIGPVVPGQKFREVIDIIINSGTKHSEAIYSSVPLEFKWSGTNYLGAAHGLAGILYILLLVRDHLTTYEKCELIKPSLEWLITQRFSSKNFKSSEYSEADRLVQWCHGAPGFVHLFLLASQVFEKTRYFQISLECSDVVWKYGILRKGYSLCHGVSGNAYSFLAIYSFSKDLKYLYRAAAFADWCCYHPKMESRKPDAPYSMFQGIAGIAYFLFDIQDPQTTNFPGFELK